MDCRPKPFHLRKKYLKNTKICGSNCPYHVICHYQLELDIKDAQSFLKNKMETYIQNWQKSHRDYLKKYRKEYYKKNKDKILSYLKKHYKKTYENLSRSR